MADIFDPAKRSWIMSRIQSRDTTPEKRVRALLHKLGFRFRIRGLKNKTLPGHPDIVLTKWKTVIFVHGCFWHGHEGCKDFRIPKTRTEWWTNKLEGNRTRDARSVGLLEEAGWRVLTIWACETGTVAALAVLEGRLAAWIRGDQATISYHEADIHEPVLRAAEPDEATKKPSPPRRGRALKTEM